MLTKSFLVLVSTLNLKGINCTYFYTVSIRFPYIHEKKVYHELP